MPEAEEADNDELDWDSVFAYDTVKEVRVLDRRLGGVYYVVLGMVLFYVIIFVMIIKKQYEDMEKSNGFVMTKVVNPSYANDTIPFDVFDAVVNPGESGALFIPTRVLVTKGQSQSGSCEHPGYPCKTDADCDDGTELTEKKCSNEMCVRRGWCPAEKTGAETTTVYKVDAEKFDLWFQGKVLFHKFMTDIGNTGDTAPVYYPSPDANTFPMHDIMRMASVKMEDVWKDGAVMLISMIFDCKLADNYCNTWIESSVVDSRTGFNFKKNYYYEENGEMKRDSYWFYGIRMINIATGIGRVASVAQVVLQFSQAIALLGCAGAVADVFLQYIVPERNHYIAEKVIETEDFGE